jgi:VanZ family protein
MHPGAASAPPDSIRTSQLELLDLYSVQRAARIVGWLLLVMIVFFSLSPASYRPVTQLGHNPEHFFAHVLLGLAFGIGYARRWWLLVLSLVALTGAIEFAQLFVPGRHARLKDLVIDAGAACLGIGLAWLGKIVTSAFFRPSRP